MGVYSCKIHGISEVTFVCPHIGKLVEIGSRINDFLELKIDIIDDGDILSYYFCFLCLEDYKLPKTSHVLSYLESDNYEEALDTVWSICGECLSAAKMR